MIKSDIVIIGGGPAGLLLAAKLAQQDLMVKLIDQGPINNNQFDARNIAISYKASQVLSSIGAWQPLVDKVGTMNDIYVNSPNGFMRYDRRKIFDHPIGYTALYNDLKGALWERACKSSNVEIIANVRYKDIQINATSAILTTDSNQKISASLIICADGANSQIRRDMNFDVKIHDYRQVCVTFFARHTQPSCNIAIEHFDKELPFAILPTIDPFVSSFILLMKDSKSNAILNASEQETIDFCNKKMPIFFGKTIKTESKMGFPLKLRYVRKGYRERFLLAGDAMHAIHPVTGQGFNLSARDAATLCEVLGDAIMNNEDIGSTNVLCKFCQKRDPLNLAVINYTDKIIRSFSGKAPIVGRVVSMGFNLIDKSDYIKKLIITAADR